MLIPRISFIPFILHEMTNNRRFRLQIRLQSSF